MFSATLSKELQVNLKKKRSSKGSTKHYKREEKSSSTLGMSGFHLSLINMSNRFVDDLLLQLDFRDPEPAVIDLSPRGGVVSTLQEGKIECLSGDKVCLRCLLLRSGSGLPLTRLTGLLYLLFLTSAPRQNFGVPLFDRRHPAPHSSPCVIGHQRISSPLPTRATATAQEPRQVFVLISLCRRG